MMKIQKNNSNTRKNIAIFASIAGIIIVGLGVYLYFAQSESDKTTSSSPTNEQIDDGKATKKATIDNTSSTKPASNSDTPTEPAKGTISASIPYADSTRLTVLIDGILNGTCSLELTNGTSTVTKTAPVQPGPNSSTCQGFSYDTLSPGEWTATVAISSSDSNGSVTKSITVE